MALRFHSKLSSIRDLFLKHYKPTPNTIYLGNGLLDYQSFHFTDLSFHYLGRPKSLKVVSESPISHDYKSAMATLAPRTAIRYITLHRHPLNSFPFKALRLLAILPFALFCALKATRSSLLNRSHSWFVSQILHGIWDSSLRYSPNNTINPSYLRRVTASLSNLSHLVKAIKFAIVYRPTIIFLGHSVYSGRSSLAFYRLLPIPVYIHSFNTLNRAPSNFDSSLFTPTSDEADALLSISRSLDASPFWSKRLSGNSSYFDAQESFRGLDAADTTPLNVIYLHIFKDSPFNHIDRTRIFADYFDWTLQTLRIISKSSESWLLKTHPSAARWGEDSLSILQSIVEIVFPTGLPSHISIDHRSLSNASILAHAQRVITFSGSVHLEAAAHGIKPIVISSSLLDSLLPSLVHKPNSCSEYEHLLLLPSYSESFHLTPSETSLSRQILFLKEDLLPFTNNFTLLPLYPGDSKEYQSKVSTQFIDSYLSNNSYSQKLAYCLSRGLTRTTSSTIIDAFSNYYFCAR